MSSMKKNETKYLYPSNDFPQQGVNLAIGFVLLKTSPAAERDVYELVKDLEEVVEVHSLFGEYDLILKLQAEDFNSLGKIVVDEIRSIDGVEDTKTLTGIEF